MSQLPHEPQFGIEDSLKYVENAVHGNRHGSSEHLTMTREQRLSGLA